MSDIHRVLIWLTRENFIIKTSTVWAIFSLAVKKFLRIDGARWAAAFSYYAFFSLFPLIVLFVTAASIFIDQEQAGVAVIAYVQTYVPISGKMQSYIFDTIYGVINARGRAGAVAFFMLIWAAMKFFNTLISAMNKAWGIRTFNWWRLPLKSLGFLSIMVSVVLLGIAMPVLAKAAKDWLFQVNDYNAWFCVMGSYFTASMVVFLSLSLLFRLAPNRPTRLAEVWVAAFCTTALLQVAQGLFVIYLKDFATLNAVYGSFGGIMALLLWIYLSGCIFIFGACMCAAQAEVLVPTGPVMSRSIRE